MTLLDCKQNPGQKHCTVQCAGLLLSKVDRQTDRQINRQTQYEVMWN